MTDDDLLADLRRVVEAAEPVPDVSVRLAESAIAWRTIDEDLAELVHDSAVDDDALVVRGGVPDQRVLSFVANHVRIDVEYSGRQLIGLVVPPAAVTIELRRPGTAEPVVGETDEFGAFLIDGVGRGPATLVCRAHDGSWSARTSWTNL